jgi:dTDP-4-amino-4,6-dideoxygalactose transaminase
MRACGVQTSIHYPAIHLFRYYQQTYNVPKGSLPLTEFISEHEVTLPMHSLLRNKDVEFIVQSIDKSLN